MELGAGTNYRGGNDLKSIPSREWPDKADIRFFNYITGFDYRKLLSTQIRGITKKERLGRTMREKSEGRVKVHMHDYAGSPKRWRV
jgi:hypothetical protein